MMKRKLLAMLLAGTLALQSMLPVLAKDMAAESENASQPIAEEAAEMQTEPATESPTEPPIEPLTEPSTALPKEKRESAGSFEGQAISETEARSGTKTIYAGGECGPNVQWKLLEDGTFYLLGAGGMDSYTYQSLPPWYSDINKITNVMVTEGITNIGSCAFAGCVNLKSIELPFTLTSIGDYAFHDCRSLESIELPVTLTSIGDYAFHDCRSLMNIELPPGVTGIEEHAFLGCGGDRGSFKIIGEKGSCAEKYAALMRKSVRRSKMAGSQRVGSISRWSGS